MYTLIYKNRVVQYQMWTAAPEYDGSTVVGEMSLPVMTMAGTSFVVPFDEECRLRRPEQELACIRRPDESFVAMRRAPECPTSRYCLDCPDG